MKGIKDTSTETFRQLLGNGLSYTVPKFQRDYSWTREQWDDLWQDIEAVRAGIDPAHYLGYLVLQTQNNKNYSIIDGQQRITTLCLLVLAVIKVLEDFVEEGIKPAENQQRVNSFRSSYIGYLDPVSLVAQNKLTLNRNNDDFYRQKLVTLQDLPKRGLKASEKLLKNCFEWFHGKVKSQFKTGEHLAEFLDEIVDKLFFTVIQVDDDLNAFRVFETLNARGVQLSSADLLKNYLFSIVDAEGSHSSEMREMESLWSNALNKLGGQRFPEFLRTYWNSHKKTVRKNDLFKAIRREVKTKVDAFNLIRDLDKSADLYIALRTPEDEFWSSHIEIRYKLRDLKLFQVRQPIAVLMAAYDNLSLDRFKTLLRSIVIVSFRYNIIGGFNANEQETVYNDIALKLRSGEAFDLNMLRTVYPADSSFKAEFSNAEFRKTSKNHKIAKYILAHLEKQQYSTNVDWISQDLTIEHILPDSESENWMDIDDQTFDRIVYRLGNLCLIERNLNQEAGVLGYSDKKAIYRKSRIASTASIPDKFDQWDENAVNSRQNELARLATGIWQLNIN
ncbi:MAG: DUF262 domain-containing HNH endonuclease family protein [Bacteroidota bacterium]